MIVEFRNLTCPQYEAAKTPDGWRVRPYGRRDFEETFQASGLNDLAVQICNTLVDEGGHMYPGSSMVELLSVWKRMRDGFPGSER